MPRIGEAVKEKIEKRRTRAYAYALGTGTRNALRVTSLVQSPTNNSGSLENEEQGRHPIFGVMRFYKEEKRRIHSYGLFAHLLLNGMLHTKTYLMLTGFGESHGTGMLRS